MPRTTVRGLQKSTAMTGTVRRRAMRAAAAIRAHAQPLDDGASGQGALAALVARAADARVVVLGESVKGTAELCRWRAALTRALHEAHGFDVLLVDGDAGSDDAVPLLPAPLDPLRLGARVDAALAAASAEAGVARRLKERIDAAFPWEPEVQRNRLSRQGLVDTAPRGFGRALLERLAGALEDEAARGLLDEDALTRLAALLPRVAAGAFLASVDAKNAMDEAKAEAVAAALRRSATGRAIVWTSVATAVDARATECFEFGRTSLGQLCRESLGASACLLVGLRCFAGAAASRPALGAAPRRMDLRAPPEDALEQVLREAGPHAYALWHGDAGLADALGEERLARAVGAVYRPDDELMAHWYRTRPRSELDATVFVADARPVRFTPPAPLGEIRPV